MRVLLVESNPIMRTAIAGLLHDEPDVEHVEEAENGEQALDVARRLEPDVVMIPARLPKMGGVEATRAIHAEFPDICIVGMTLFESKEEAQAMRDAGAVTVVCKSQPDQLIAGMRDCYTAHRDEREMAGE